MSVPEQSDPDELDEFSTAVVGHAAATDAVLRLHHSQIAELRAAVKSLTRSVVIISGALVVAVVALIASIRAVSS